MQAFDNRGSGALHSVDSAGQGSRHPGGPVPRPGPPPAAGLPPPPAEPPQAHTWPQMVHQQQHTCIVNPKLEPCRIVHQQQHTAHSHFTAHLGGGRHTCAPMHDACLCVCTACAMVMAALIGPCVYVAHMWFMSCLVCPQSCPISPAVS